MPLSTTLSVVNISPCQTIQNPGVITDESSLEPHINVTPSS